MDHFVRAEVDYARIELLLQQHKYNEALPILSGLVEKHPSDRQARLCRLLVMRILILRHLLGRQTIGLFGRATAVTSRVSVRTSKFLAFRLPSRFQVGAWLRNPFDSFPLRLDKRPLVITSRSFMREPWFRNFLHRSRSQLISRLHNAIAVLLARLDKHRIAVAVVVPLALIVPVSVSVLVAWHVENHPRLLVGSTASNFASRETATGARPERGGGVSGKPLIVASANTALAHSSIHWALTGPDDLNPRLLVLESDALSPSAVQNIAPRKMGAEKRADEKQNAGLTKVSANHAVPKPVVQRSDASALKRSSKEHKHHVAEARKKILAHYRTKQLIPIRKSAHFAAPTIRKIAKGTTVDVLGVNNSWAEVTLKNDADNSVIGFVRVEFLVPEAVGSL